MSLSNPNPFIKGQSRDPKLFQTEIDKNLVLIQEFVHQIRRQPVILNDEEKEYIDKNHPGSYNHAIKYGTSKDKQFWYICPRYWSLKYNTSLTKEEVDSGKYENVIPLNAKKIPEGANIYEFTDPKYHINSEGEYINLSPGFEKEDKDPDGYCLPCCFKRNSKEQQEDDKFVEDKEKNGKEIEQPIDKKGKLDEYNGTDKFQFLIKDVNLPLSIQNFQN